MPVSSEQFREIFGSFPTAVAVITTVDDQGEPRGFTCNAVCSVSAAPPLLLIGVDKQSQTLPALLSTQAFVVNFLAASGQEASQVFASKSQDKFATVRWRPSDLAAGAPILTDVALAYAECRTVQTVEAGDHWLFVAQVEGGRTDAREPLLYCRGEYSIWSGLVPAGR
ncbi:flavin reductase family protein [Streptomyces sp. NPDC048514]|uniref:flavin reductase family protein n=1 Tax=Streptomyces sp. NPDC048514 TaxID=3365564 RepID=UPI00371B8E27